MSEMRDRPLDGKETTQLRTHVEHCPHCRIAAQQFADLFARVDLLLSRKPQGDHR
ncbi:MAG: zf-HC2 domain-containing protein [Methyloversatilis sp.]|nr:zf-HC2 domain-containing protein [Methyloversatilis sp.]MBP9116453.1 zf-HC2 domain-containing protein [Methyloversatilis sp.]